MRSLFLAALTVASLGTTAAFADTLTIGTAKLAPIFATPSGNSAIVAAIGSATRAPVYAVKSGTSTLVTALGGANRAPVYAQAHAQNTNLALVK